MNSNSETAGSGSGSPEVNAPPPTDRAPHTFLELIWQATDSWQRTIRLVGLIFSLALVGTAVIAVIGFGVGQSVQHRTAWENSIILSISTVTLTSLTTVGTIVLRRTLSRSLRRERAIRAAHVAAERHFIESVAKLEGAATDIVSFHVGEVPAVIPLGLMLRALEDQGVWSHRDVTSFRHLLRVRNSLVHEHDTIDVNALQREREQAERLINSLRYSATSGGGPGQTEGEKPVGRN